MYCSTMYCLCVILILLCDTGSMRRGRYRTEEEETSSYDLDLLTTVLPAVPRETSMRVRVEP